MSKSREGLPTVGISGIALHFPDNAVSLEALAEQRNLRRAEGDSRDFLRSLRYTAQEEMRIPEVWEDTVTMIAESVRRLVRDTGVDPREVSQFVCGTETAKDHAKPLTSFAQGVLEADGIPIGPRASVYEIKHACAGGTYALHGAMNQVYLDATRGFASPAIVSMSDISRYDLISTAELTQGAGAVSLLVEQDPKLIKINPGVVGYHSQSVDDFFRAIGSSVAKARGKFSVQCYKDALLGAYTNYKEKALHCGLVTPPEGGHFLDAFDYVLLHAPFRRMPIDALMDLFMKARDAGAEEAEAELERVKLHASLEGTARTGNLYTGALYVCLASLLESEYARIGDAIENRRILFASYGSGNTMVVFSGRVLPGAGEAISRIGLRDMLADPRMLSVEEYEDRMVFNKFDREAYTLKLAHQLDRIPAGRYFLREIREDGYREYACRGKEPGAQAGNAA